MKIYKVYLIKNRQTDLIVYVGLTKQTLYKRFIQHVAKRKWRNNEYKIELVQDFLTIQEAVTLEELLITQYQTRINGFNISPKSINGYSNVHSEEQKLKWSLERKGKPAKFRPSRKGLKNKPEHNKALYDATTKPVICMNNGRVYESARKAAKELGVCYKKVSLVCKGIRPHTKGYIFKFYL
jgi:hypothetical protein